MRCFIAINLYEKLRTDIGKATEPLRKAGTDVKWVASETLHITLKFLGETTDETVNDIIRIMEPKSRSLKSFDIK